jgi:phosphoribosylanthranilate isomerase
MIRVKVCGLTNPLNVKEIAKLSPDFLGFIFFPLSPRYVGEEPDMKLFCDLPSGIMRTGVFLNENSRQILEISKRIGLDVIQLHGNETPDSCLHLKSRGLTVIKAFSIDNDFNFDSLKIYNQASDFFLFDTKSETAGGSGKKFNWDKLKEYTLGKPFFLSGGIGPEDTGAFKSMVNHGLFAVDINSRFETSPGIKDSVLVKEFIDEIKYDQNEL